MRNKILFTSLSILIIFILSLIYFSIYGIKTDSFNNFINKKVKEYNSKLILKVDGVYIKFNLKKFVISINTKNVSLIAESNPIQISNIDINLNLVKFLKNENSIKNIKIKSSNNLIKDVTSFLNVIDYNLFRYVFYSQIREGLLTFELDARFDDINQDIDYYLISGTVNKAKLNIPGYENLNNINFNFQAQDKLINISNLNFNLRDINFISENLEVKEEKSGAYNIKGDIENIKAFINPDLIYKLTNIKKDYLSNKDILFESKNFFSFDFNENNEIKNLKINSVFDFDEIYFNNKYQNLIFLKEGSINSKFENNELSAEVISKFAFTDDLKLNNNYKNNNLKLLLNSKNDQKIKINGTISNGKTLIDSKSFLNFLKIDANVLSDQKINVETENNFKFEVNNDKIENYLLNSKINLDKLELNKQIQDILYLKNIKSSLTFGDKLLKVDLKSNYSFFDKNLNNDSESNIINFKLDKNDSKISNVEIFVQASNNLINIKEIKKYLNFKKQKKLIEDKVVNLNSNFTIKASLDDKLEVKNLDIKSNTNFDNLNIKYKSNILKKYLRNYENNITVKNPQILFEYSNDLINLQLNGKYLFKDDEDNFFIKFKGNKNNFELYTLLDLNNSLIKIEEIEYLKKKNTPSKLEILFNKSKNGLNFKKINFTETKNNISVKNLALSDDFKIQSVDKINVNFLNKNGVKNDFKIKKISNSYNLNGNLIDGEKIVERLLNSDNKNKLSSLFDNINTSVIINLDRIYLEKNEYLNKFEGELDIKDNKLFLAKVNAILKNKNKFSYSFRTTTKDEKITNIFVEKPRPFINNYKFIKGFEEGELRLNSIKIDNASRSNLQIYNFKVKEVPILAKILTLASLQGIADLLTGEGIRFDEFEMDFKTKSNLTEIEEMYAIGPAISIMMDGYIEKDRITSLSGTLVPATTINKTIAKIPLLGDILVGRKSGEGVFGVSFKIKGPPKNLKSTVNPIKTLTPRFITRTLEKIKGN